MCYLFRLFVCSEITECNNQNYKKRLNAEWEISNKLNLLGLSWQAGDRNFLSVLDINTS
jgi:DNA-directed RNA polymerase subunit N (RpoN/RPB10)